MDLVAQILTTVVGFFLLVAVLGRFFWRPVLTVLDQRRTQIEEDLRKIAQGHAELERLRQEYQQHLARIDEEARVKIQQAALDGKRLAAEIQEQARTQGAALLAKAKEAIELEVAKAKVTLRDEVATMTLEAAERILQRKLDPTADRRLIEAVVEELEREQAQA
jgi:F-type H+-transporting ATPase subunit b